MYKIININCSLLQDLAFRALYGEQTQKCNNYFSLTIVPSLHLLLLLCHNRLRWHLPSYGTIWPSITTYGFLQQAASAECCEIGRYTKITWLWCYFWCLLGDRSFSKEQEALELVLAWPDSVTLRYTICNMLSCPLHAILAILCMNH